MPPLAPPDVRRLITRYAEHYNTARWHSVIADLAPADQLAGRDVAILTTMRGTQTSNFQQSLNPFTRSAKLQFTLNKHTFDEYFLRPDRSDFGT